MGFVRKYFTWILLGIVLVAEAAAMVVVLGRRQEAGKKSKELEKKTQTRDTLRVKVKGAPERITLYEKRKVTATRELGETLLFFWHRGQAIEGLFPSPEFAKYSVTPWQAPPRLEVFRADYQAAYDREVASLQDKLQAVGSTAGDMQFAAPGGFMQASVTIGDIFVVQKEFYIKKALVEAVAKAKARIQRMDVGLSSRRREPEEDRHGTQAAPTGILFDSIPVQLNLEVEYVRLHELLEDLLRLPVCFRITSVQKVERMDLKREAGMKAAAAAAAAAAGTASVGTTPEAEPFERTARRVAVEIVGEVLDLAIDIKQVVFTRKHFATSKDKVLGWLTAEQAGLAKLERRCQAAIKSGRRATWIGDELARLQQPAAEPGSEEEPAASSVLIRDRLVAPGRVYEFADARAARDWLENRYSYELLRVRSLTGLWERVRRIIQAGKANEKGKDGITVAFRPENHFDKKQLFTPQPLDAAGYVTAQLGLVTFLPEVSIQGVKRAEQK